jgi:hypothetical protein
MLISDDHMSILTYCQYLWTEDVGWELRELRSGRHRKARGIVLAKAATDPKLVGKRRVLLDQRKHEGRL